MGLFTAKATLPVGSAADSMKQELKVFVDGADFATVTRILPRPNDNPPVVGDPPLVEVKDLPEGKLVRMELRDIDDANLPSEEPNVIEFTPVDTTPPPKSGDFSITLEEQA